MNSPPAVLWRLCSAGPVRCTWAPTTAIPDSLTIRPRTLPLRLAGSRGQRTSTMISPRSLVGYAGVVAGAAPPVEEGALAAEAGAGVVGVVVAGADVASKASSKPPPCFPLAPAAE